MTLTPCVIYRITDGVIVGTRRTQNPELVTAPEGCAVLIDVVASPKIHRVVLDAQGQPVVEVAPPAVPTANEVRRELTVAVQAHLDGVAQGLGYDSIFTACTYAEEPAVPKFQAEGAALRAWRSVVWAACYQVMAEVLAGTRSAPTPDELVEALPEFVLPPP